MSLSFESSDASAILPRKSKLYTILIFAFAVGMLATFAEPAIAVLRAAGKNVTQADAPLLHGLLNDFSGQLVFSVGLGVGIAVCCGVLRFLYGWSLKVFIFPLVIVLAIVTIIAHQLEILQPIIGLAWDCGAVTTGPVTVPLVLALGIGVCRVVGTESSGNSGFGIVTLASLFPILAVLGLGIYHYCADDYYGRPNYQGNSKAVEKSVIKDNKQFQFQGFSQPEIDKFLADGIVPSGASIAYRGGKNIIRDGKIFIEGSTVVLTKQQQSSVITDDMEYWDSTGSLLLQIKDAVIAAIRAIIPLCLLLFITLKFLREKVPHADEIMVGVSFAVIGMALFGLGIILGLTPLGEQLGSNVPSAFATITPWGLKGYQGPLYGAGLTGKLVAVAFAFFLGYGATIAEPALNALGATVEKLTVGAFKKSLLMQAVAIGVAIGISMFFWFTFAVFSALGSAAILSPFISAFAPLFIFAIISGYLFMNVKT